MKRGLVEWAFVTAFVALAAGGAIALFGDELRAALGLGPAPAPAAAPAAAAPPRPAAPPAR
jgi:hypothetical protein